MIELKYKQVGRLLKMKNYKKLLVGTTMVIALTLAGCSTDDGAETDTTVEDGTEQVAEAQPLVIAQPEILQIEDDVVDVAQLQANLDAINNGERLDSYEPVNEDERVLEVPTNPEFDDSVYTAKDPKDLHEGTHFLYVGRVTCPYCVMLRTNLDPVVGQLDLDLGYVDTDIPEDEQYMVEEFGLTSVPQIVVFHEGEVVASFPQQNMFLEEGVDYQSLANGLGDLTNIYLMYKHDVELTDNLEPVEEEDEVTETDSSVEEDSEGEGSEE